MRVNKIVQLTLSGVTGFFCGLVFMGVSGQDDMDTSGGGTVLTQRPVAPLGVGAAPSILPSRGASPDDLRQIVRDFGLRKDVVAWLDLSRGEAREIGLLTQTYFRGVENALTSGSTVSMTEDGSFLITSEPFVDVGGELRDEFLRGLRSQLGGDERFWVFWDHIKDAVHKRSAGHGAAHRVVDLRKTENGWTAIQSDRFPGSSRPQKTMSEHEELPTVYRDIVQAYSGSRLGSQLRTP